MINIICRRGIFRESTKAKVNTRYSNQIENHFVDILAISCLFYFGKHVSQVNVKVNQLKILKCGKI